MKVSNVWYFISKINGIPCIGKYTVQFVFSFLFDFCLSSEILIWFLEVTCIIILCHSRTESHRLWNWSLNCVTQDTKFLNSSYWRLLVFMFLFLYRNDTGFQSKSTAIVSASGSSERFRLSLNGFYSLKRFQDDLWLLAVPFFIFPRVRNAHFVGSVHYLVFFLNMYAFCQCRIVFMYLGLTFSLTIILTKLLLFMHYRNLSTSALMERMPSKWPRPVWHAPWKNYRVWSIQLSKFQFWISFEISKSDFTSKIIDFYVIVLILKSSVLMMSNLHNFQWPFKL